MKAASFRFLRAKSVADAVALKVDYGEDARFIAGGQSLVPALNLRLLEPRALIDIAGLRDLSGISLADGRLVIGALTRHAQLANDPLIAAHAPLLLRALPYVAHAAIRNRGTFGGSIALADPAAEWPACCLALDAEMIFTGPQITGERRIAAADFFRGFYATALGPDDLLLRVELPIQKPGARSVALELARRHGDFAIVGIDWCLGGIAAGAAEGHDGQADIRRFLRYRQDHSAFAGAVDCRADVFAHALHGRDDGCCSRPSDWP